MKIREAGPEDAEGIASVHISNASVPEGWMLSDNGLARG